MQHKAEEKRSIDVYFWVNVELKVKKENVNDFLEFIKPENLSMYLQTNDMDDVDVDGCEDLKDGFYSVKFSGDITRKVSINHHDLADIFTYQSISPDVFSEIVSVANELQNNLKKLLREGPIVTQNSRVCVSEPDVEELIDIVFDQVRSL